MGDGPVSVSRDFRWDDAPRPDPDAGTVPLAPTSAADDPDALETEASAWCADPARALRSGLVADLAEALRRERTLCETACECSREHIAEIRRLRDERNQAVSERDEARDQRDRLARRLRNVVRNVRAVLDGSSAVVPPDADSDDGPCGWTSR